jgi:hypothetical protein
MGEKAHREGDIEAARPTTSPEQNTEKAVTVTDRSPSPSDSPSSSNADIIDWKGPDDPELPINWPRAKKWRNVLLVATLTFLTSVSLSSPALHLH